MIVVDASVLLHIFLDTVENDLVQRIFEGSDGVIAPHIIDLEVINGIRKNLRLGIISVERANFAIEDLRKIPIERKPTHLLNNRIWQLRDNFTPYDASYVSLAEVNSAALLTRDLKLASAIKAHTKVELI